MNAGYRKGILLLGALALWSPTAMETLRGRVDFPVAALRLAACVVFAWAAVRLFGRIVDGYADGSKSRDQPRRRASDHPDPAGDDAGTGEQP